MALSVLSLERLHEVRSRRFRSFFFFGLFFFMYGTGVACLSVCLSMRMSLRPSVHTRERNCQVDIRKCLLACERESDDDNDDARYMHTVRGE